MKLIFKQNSITIFNMNGLLYYIDSANIRHISKAFAFTACYSIWNRNDAFGSLLEALNLFGPNKLRLDVEQSILPELPDVDLTKIYFDDWNRIKIGVDISDQAEADKEKSTGVKRAHTVMVIPTSWADGIFVDKDKSRLIIWDNYLWDDHSVKSPKDVGLEGFRFVFDII